MNNKPFIFYDEEEEGATIESLRFNKYADGNLAVIALINWHEDNEEEQQPISINLAHGQEIESKNLAKGEFFVKNYAEGEVVFKALLAAKWIQTTGQKSRSGYVDVPVCKIGENAIIS